MVAKDPGHKIEIEWPDNYGRGWVELLEDSKLTEHARICYVVMTSFGRESRAGTRAIMRRMGVKAPATVREAQALLVLTGWMRRLKEATPTEPAHWLMLAPKNRGEGNDVYQGGQPHLRGEGNDVAPKQEEKQERKERAMTPLQAEAHNLGILFGALWKGRYSRSDDYRPSEEDKKKLLTWAKAGVTPALFKAKVEAMLAIETDWYFQNRHNIWLLERDWNKLEAVEVTATREACKHPLDKMQNVTDYGPQILGTCGVCGWKGYVTKEQK